MEKIHLGELLMMYKIIGVEVIQQNNKVVLKLKPQEQLNLDEKERKKIARKTLCKQLLSQKYYFEPFTIDKLYSDYILVNQILKSYKK